VCGAGLCASAFHLGRPAHALRAVKGWRHSWLSREVIAFLAFGLLGGLAAGAAAFSDAEPGAAALGLLAAAVTSGLVGVYSSARIYLLRARPAWNTWRTPAQFFGTMILLGAAGGLAVISASPGGLEPGRTHVPWALAGAISLSGLLLALLPWTLIASEPRAESAVRDTARLLTLRFQKLLWFRTAALLVVAILAPLSFAPVQQGAMPFLSAGVLALALLSEGASRYLFFVTVVPLDIPGHFFDVKSRYRLEAALP
jgi:formate dehydrogenase iron-sulfur subunit